MRTSLGRQTVLTEPRFPNTHDVLVIAEGLKFVGQSSGHYDAHNRAYGGSELTVSRSAAPIEAYVGGQCPRNLGCYGACSA
jgi:hypothetical protein